MTGTSRLLAAAAGAAALGATALSGAKAEPIVIGSTNFTEQLILANIYEDALEDAGVEVETRLNLGSREVVFPALLNDEIDALPEYSGALLAHVTEGNAEARTSKAVLRQLQKHLPDALTALEPSSAQNKDALVVREETADKHGLVSVSDLTDVAGEMVLGGPPEMKTRRVGIPGLKDVYGLEFAAFRSLDAGGPLTKNALKNGDIDVARMFTTQGAIDANGWVVLNDDENLIPAQNLLPVVRQDALTPKVRETLNAVSGELTTRALTRMNRRVGVDQDDPEQVAADWANEHGF